MEIMNALRAAFAITPSFLRCWFLTMCALLGTNDVLGASLVMTTCTPLVMGVNLQKITKNPRKFAMGVPMECKNILMNHVCVNPGGWCAIPMKKWKYMLLANVGINPEKPFCRLRTADVATIGKPTIQNAIKLLTRSHHLVYAFNPLMEYQNRVQQTKFKRTLLWGGGPSIENVPEPCCGNMCQRMCRDDVKSHRNRRLNSFSSSCSFWFGITNYEKSKCVLACECDAACGKNGLREFCSFGFGRPFHVISKRNGCINEPVNLDHDYDSEDVFNQMNWFAKTIDCFISHMRKCWLYTCIEKRTYFATQRKIGRYLPCCQITPIENACSSPSQVKFKFTNEPMPPYTEIVQRIINDNTIDVFNNPT